MKYVLALLVILAILISSIPLVSQPAQAYLMGTWLPCTVDNATTTSAALDLGDDYYYLNLYTPTITTGTVTIQVARELTGTYAADGQTAIGLTSTSGGFYSTLVLGGYRYVKIVTGATQIGGAAAFWVRGYRP